MVTKIMKGRNIPGVFKLSCVPQALCLQEIFSLGAGQEA